MKHLALSAPLPTTHPPSTLVAVRPGRRLWRATSSACALALAALLICSGPAWAKDNDKKKKGKQPQRAAQQQRGGGGRPQQAGRAPQRGSFQAARRAPAGRRPEFNRQPNRGRESFQAGRNRPSEMSANRNRQTAQAAQINRNRAAEMQRAQAGRKLGAAAHRQPDRDRGGFQSNNLSAAQRQALARPGRNTTNFRNNNQVRNRYANRNVVINKRSYVSNRNVFSQRIRVERNVYAPRVVSRDWDRGRDHSWNNHHFHWRDNAWVVIDLGDTYTPYGSTGLYRGFAEPSPEVIQQVQFALNDRGYNAGEPDGLYGPQTREAMRAFQDDQGFLVTGWIDQSALNALDI